MTRDTPSDENSNDYALKNPERELMRRIDEELAGVDISQPALRTLLRDLRLSICRLSADLWACEMGKDLDGCIIWELRESSKRIVGGNCSFADDDLAVLSHLARRAVEAGLTDTLHKSIQDDIANKVRAPDTRGEANTTPLSAREPIK